MRRKGRGVAVWLRGDGLGEITLLLIAMMVVQLASVAGDSGS